MKKQCVSLFGSSNKGEEEYNYVKVDSLEDITRLITIQSNCLLDSPRKGKTKQDQIKIDQEAIFCTTARV